MKYVYEDMAYAEKSANKKDIVEIEEYSSSDIFRLMVIFEDIWEVVNISNNV